MTLLDWLRKLGILRYGSVAGVYHNAKERPINFQMPGVFDEEKDVINLNKPAEQKPPLDSKEELAG